ncbi:MAG: hypothetical protein JW996_07735, partial [Candidatus Cloacimonetes bacterium]|nr:hypothetical protein [Candidatus Cloacimonadota bacterium]
MYEQEFQTIFNHARNLVDDIEIMLVSGNSFSVRIHEQQIEAFNYNDSKGIGVRVIKNGKVGYAYTEEFTEEAFRLIVEEAAENSKFNEESDPVIMADYPDVDNKPNVYSKELDLVPVEQKIQYAKDL